MQRKIYMLEENKNVKDILKEIYNDEECIFENIEREQLKEKLQEKSIIIINSSNNSSPLTGLPGNNQIHEELQKRIIKKEKFAVLYLDLDNFKAYNDVYGFLKGDILIKYTADTIVTVIKGRNIENSFIGHIGGDDFVAIILAENVEDLCQTIIATFDLNVNRFFSEEDLQKGYIETENRKGIKEQFPLTSLSIGAVICEPGRFKNILEIGEVGAQVKHIAKTVMGSSYAIDRRKK
ncbi:MAG: GGDEF domain-containing protein [Clostridia bacterium]|nr:GGDEF domain-containing protein [Clostridia bacterium]